VVSDCAIFYVMDCESQLFRKRDSANTALVIALLLTFDG